MKHFMVYVNQMHKPCTELKFCHIWICSCYHNTTVHLGWVEGPVWDTNKCNSLFTFQNLVCVMSWLGGKTLHLKCMGCIPAKKSTCTRESPNQKEVYIGVCHFIERLLVDWANHRIPVGTSCQLWLLKSNNTVLLRLELDISAPLI